MLKFILVLACIIGLIITGPIGIGILLGIILIGVLS